MFHIYTYVKHQKKVENEDNTSSNQSTILICYHNYTSQIFVYFQKYISL